MSLTKKAIGGSIHRIREFELEKVNLADEFDILQIVGEGWFGKILLTEHRSTQTEMVLKALPKAYTGITDFYREFHYGLHLSAHRNIITTYDVAFETAGFYIFSQEYAPLGDLTSNVSETGLGELHAKRVARQLAAAVHHIHSRELVHRDIKLDNILVFRSDFSRIKLCDFGETRRANTIVRRHNEWLPYSPPEVLQIDTDETYKALTSHDVWQFGIVLFVCLTGCIPWQKAATDDRRYTRYVNWHTATLNIAKKPKLFQLISSRAQRMFKRLLEPKLDKRPISVLEVNKYLEDRWLAKLGAEKALNGGADERDELSPSMYSFHSSLEEKNQLLYTLTQYGIETTVDRTRKKDRIREWIRSSAIAEENEDETSDIDDNERINGNSEIEDETVMRGRHYPERRPSTSRTIVESDVSRKLSTSESMNSRDEQQHNIVSDTEVRKNGTSGKTRRANTILSSNHRAARTLKRMERRNPFAPQVAQERHTVARFASFPNGDPSLAITSNNLTTSELVTENTMKFAELEMEQRLIRSAGSINDHAIGSSSFSTDRTFVIPPPVAVERQKQEQDTTRSSTFVNIAINDDTRYVNETTEIITKFKQEHRSNDRESLNDRTTIDQREKDKIIYEQKRQLNPQVPMRKNRSQNLPFTTTMTSQQPRNNDYQVDGIVKRSVSPVNSSTAGQSAIEPIKPHVPIMTNNNNNTSSINNNNNSNSNVNNNSNPLTMTVASHLVMQSFNALQAMNTLPTSTTINDKQSIHNKDIVSEKTRNIATYGKDAYEHYGIAQRVVGTTRNDSTRHGSTGSGSRSVSN